MELDIILKRDEKQPWGFRLIGGTDFEMPLTVVKVQQQSLAEQMGLRNGDSIISINDKPAIKMTHDAAHDAIVRAGNYLHLHIFRGPFDHLQEAGFQPITTNPDIDHMFQPSEVDGNFPTNRSATSSPFLITPKPYRPFSTEPIEVPPVESPIILNPGYKDDFPKIDDKEPHVETIFKLPISSQYVPDKASNRSKACSRIDFKIDEFIDTNIEQKQIFKEKNGISTSVGQNTVEEIRFMKEINQEIDITKIEETALVIVDESIEKALTVTEEIKNEIDIELIESTLKSNKKVENLKSIEESIASESKNSKSTLIRSNQEMISNVITSQTNEETEYKESQQTTLVEKLNNINISNENVVTDVKTNNEIKEENVIIKKKKKQENESVDLQEDTLKDQVQNEITTKEILLNSAKEIITNGTTLSSNKDVYEKNSQSFISSDNTNVTKQSVESKKVQQNQMSETIKQNSSSSKKKISTSNLLAEQRAYVLGLQTIPNIKGQVHSSWHYDLLLKTFFIHLTDVMVALSRFILFDRPLSKSNSTEDISNEVTENLITKTEDITKTNFEYENTEKRDVVNTENQIKTDSSVVKQDDLNIMETKIISDAICNNIEQVKSQNSTAEFLELNKRTGSKMAQLTANKSNELIQKMDAVVSEFQSKTNLEETNINLELEMSKESDPLEWLSKNDEINKIDAISSFKQGQIVSKTDIHQTALQETSVTHIKEFETNSKSEFINDQQTVSEVDKAKTYVAIVEAHVYTNKNAIIEDKTTKQSEATEEQISKEISQSSLKITSNEVKEEAEISLEEAIAKSNFAIVTCETINKDITEENEIVDFKTEQCVKSEGYEDENFKLDDQQNIKECVIDIKETTAENVLQEKNQIEFNSSKRNIFLTQEAIKTHNDETIIHNLEEVEKMAAEYQNVSIMNEELNVVGVQDIKETLQEASFIAKTVNTLNENNETKMRKLSLNIIKQDELSKTKFESQISVQSDASSTDIKTPTPSTIPPTPLTDEYVFRLEIPLAVSSSGNPDIIEEIPNIETEDHEDPHIVKKKLIPHIETTIESVIYDEPLATPIANNITPAFIQHGLDSTKEKVKAKVFSEEEILEIERKSSLLASAIDETIKSIEEYKEQVGLETEFGKESIQNEMHKKQHIDLEDIKMNQEISHVKNNFGLKTVQDTVTDVTQNIQNQMQIYKATAELKLNSFAQTENSLESVKNTSSDTQNIDVAQISVETTQNISSAIQKGFEAVQSNTKTTQNESATIQNGFTSLQNNFTSIQNGITSTQNSYETTQNGLTSLQNLETTQKSFENICTNSFNKKQNEVYFEEQKNNNEFKSDIKGTTEGIMNTMEGSTVLDAEVAKELGKPGMTEDKIAELISGESEMLREAHVMGLKRVLASHMNRPDDSSVDFKKLKPIIENLNNSEVLKALNEEIIKTRDERKKDNGKWTTFLQKPKRPIPKAKFGYCFRLTQEAEDEIQEPYRVKIVKQPKPKVAPDYIPEVEDFETGPLPWEERAAKEPPPPPVPREDPILVPEELPEYLEAVDPLPESEVPDLEDTGIPLPSPKKTLPPPQPTELSATETVENPADIPEINAKEEEEVVITEEENKEDMEQARIAQEILGTVQNMVDPNATLEQQLGQMRAQLAALAQLPGVIQQTLELVTKQLTTLSTQEISQSFTQASQETVEQTNVTTEVTEEQSQISDMRIQQVEQKSEVLEQSTEQVQSEIKTEAPSEELEKIRAEEMMIMEEQRRVEKEKKELERLELESRQIKQRATPRVGKPKPAFGPLTPQERPMVLPGGRKWRSPKDAYNEEFIAETLTAQAEIIQGKAMGLPYESAYLPYDERDSNCHFVNEHVIKDTFIAQFEKIMNAYEKPPVSLEHLKDSDVYKLVHNMDEAPVRRVDMLTPVIAECDYREKCRSVTPSADRMQQHQTQP